MYLRCPECKTRYEITASSIPDGGARVRCPRCRTVFSVARPPAPPDPAVPNGSRGEAASYPDPREGRLETAHVGAQAHEAAPLGPTPLGRDPFGSGRGREVAVDESTADAVAQAMGLPGEDTQGDDDDTPAGGFWSRIEEAQADAAVESLTSHRDDRGAVRSAASDGSDGLDDTDPLPLPTRGRLPGAGTRPVPPAGNVVAPGAPVDADVARRIARALVSELLMSRREVRDEALRDGTLLARLGVAILDAGDRYRQRVGAAMSDEHRFFQEAVNDILGEGRPLL